MTRAEEIIVNELVEAVQNTVTAELGSFQPQDEATYWGRLRRAVQATKIMLKGGIDGPA